MKSSLRIHKHSGVSVPPLNTCINAFLLRLSSSPANGILMLICISNRNICANHVEALTLDNSTAFMFLRVVRCFNNDQDQSDSDTDRVGLFRIKALPF